MKKALILINIGTPDKPEKKAVRRYLSEFLNDRLVIDIPWLLQKILVNLIIIPFRVGNSTKLYQKLWTSKGSPLLFYQNNLVKKLNQKYGEHYDVFSAMRYGNPSLKQVLTQLEKKGYTELLFFPMYPQYATSTTLSTKLKVEKELKKWKTMPKLLFVEQFYNHPAFIEAFVKNIEQYHIAKYDHIIFSYHGLPDRQVNKIHPGIDSKTCTCHLKMPEHGQKCYKATCYQTSRLLATKLGLKENDYTVSFQSRLSNNWLTPFTDATLHDLIKKGHKKVLVVAPAFVTDCLETVIEIGYEYKEMFLENGGEELQMVESLNDNDSWVDAVYAISKNKS